MKHLLIITCLLVIAGCGLEQALQGTTDEEYAAWLRETSYYQPFYPSPPIYYQYPDYYMDFRPPSIINPDGSTNISEMMRRNEVDDMLWEHQHGAPFPFENP